MLSLYWPITKVDGTAREVWGYASTEARDSQGEIVTREALLAALPDYMRFANIREMHRPSAVGVARAAEVDENGLYLQARIVDADAWEKVREGVYKGFSIGGIVTQRDEAQPHIITGVEVFEISLVDRPANPEAIFEVWKGADMGGNQKETGVLSNELKSARARLAQKWVASDGSAFDRADEAAKHEAELPAPDAAGFESARASLADALGKADTFAPASEPTSGMTAYDLEGADGKKDEGEAFADPGYQPDGKQRYPVTDEREIRAAWSFINRLRNQKPYSKEQVDSIKARIVAAWKAKIDAKGPPAAQAEKMRKGLQDVARLACLIEELEWLCQSVAADQEAGNASSTPSDLQDILTRLCAVLRGMVDEETEEFLGDAADGDGDALQRAAIALAPGRAASLLGVVRGARLAKAAPSVMARLPRLVEALEKVGARHSHADFTHIQKIHDHTVELGAHCAGAEEEPASAVAKLIAKNAALEQQLGAAVPLLLQVKSLVEKVAAQPAVVPPSRLHAVEKSSDVARELERIAEQPPALTAFELIKRAMQEPLSFGAKLSG
jgi:phage head maturation protease